MACCICDLNAQNWRSLHERAQYWLIRDPELLQMTIYYFSSSLSKAQNQYKQYNQLTKSNNPTTSGTIIQATVATSTKQNQATDHMIRVPRLSW